ncbi:alpha/beta hydrolase [Halobellus sp. Atlit-31R]|nr:alpha/beta hydrolase [Halobellus sp. Atlit-31R]
MRRASDVTPSHVGVPGESRFLDVGDVTLHTVVAGPEDGEPVVLLHGFPEFWYGWHEYLEPLSEAGYRVIVPDQRGYHRSEKPAAVSAYHPDRLAADVSGLLDALEVEAAHVVGHDWGALVAWWLGLHDPDRIRTLSVLNVPHPSAFRRALTRDPRQLLKSWYAGFFQLPRVPELVARAGNWRVLTDVLERTSRPETFDCGDFERYRTAWAVDGAYRSMVNWYRAIARANPTPRTTRVTPPTLVLWGAQDDFLQESLAADSAAYCAQSRLVVLDDATHWLHHEEPARVSDELTRQFQSGV